MAYVNGERWTTISGGDVLRAIRRRWLSAGAVTLLVTAAVVALLVSWPNQYASEGMVFVRLGRGSVSLDPTTTTSPTVSLQESRAAEVASVREMLASREMARRVVDAIGVAEILQPRHWTTALLQRIEARRPAWAGGPAADGAAQDRQYAEAIRHEEAIAAVQEALEVSVAENAYTLIVHAQFGEPHLAQAIVQNAMELANQYHLEAHRADGSLAFFERQQQEAFDAAVAAQQGLKDAKNQMGMLSAEAMELALRERITQLQTQLDLTDSQAEAAAAEIDQLNQQIAALAAWIPTEVTKGVGHGAGDGMRTALFELEMEGSESTARYTPEHPLYRQMQERLEASKEIVGQQAQERLLTQEALNPIRQNLESMLRSSRARAAGLQAQQQSLRELHDAAYDQLRQLNSDAVQLAQLQWQASVAEQNYLTHARSLEQARVLHALDDQQISDLSIIQPAALMLKKVGPPRMMLTLVGCLLGLALGVLQALVRDDGSMTARLAAGDNVAQRSHTHWHSGHDLRGQEGHVLGHRSGERPAYAADDGDASAAFEPETLAGPARPR